MKAFGGSSGTQTKCATCSRSVYSNDPQISLDGVAYHKECAKCTDCNCQITLANFCKFGTTLYCKTHYFKRFKEEGGYLGDDKYAHKSSSGGYIPKDSSFVPKGDGNGSTTTSSGGQESTTATTTSDTPPPPVAQSSEQSEEQPTEQQTEAQPETQPEVQAEVQAESESEPTPQTQEVSSEVEAAVTEPTETEVQPAAAPATADNNEGGDASQSQESEGV